MKSATANPVDIQKEILRHYARKRINSQKRAQSTKPRINNQSDRVATPEAKGPTLEQLLRNEERVAHPSDPLQFRELPRKLKVYFPKGPSPPPQLPKIPYTYEEVPMQPVKIPKRKRGYLPQWVFDQQYSGWDKDQIQEKNERRNNRFAFTQKGLQLAKKFQKSVKKILNEVKLYRLSDVYAKNPKSFEPYKSEGSHDFFRKIKQGDAQAVEKLLRINPSLLLDYDQHKLSPLHWAAREGHADVVKVLTQKFKANLNARDLHGRAPLHLAVMYRRTECIYRLFIQGAKLTVLDNNKRQVKDLAPDIYSKYVLEKLDQIRFLVTSRGQMPPEELKRELQKQIRKTLDPSSAYF